MREVPLELAGSNRGVDGREGGGQSDSEPTQPFWLRRWRVKAVSEDGPTIHCSWGDQLLSLKRDCSHFGEKKDREVARNLRKASPSVFTEIQKAAHECQHSLLLFVYFCVLNTQYSQI